MIINKERANVTKLQATLARMRWGFGFEMGDDEGFMEAICDPYADDDLDDDDFDGVNLPPPFNKYEAIHLVAYTDGISLHAFSSDHFVVIFAPSLDVLIMVTDWERMTAKPRVGVVVERYKYPCDAGGDPVLMHNPRPIPSASLP